MSGEMKMRKYYSKLVAIAVLSIFLLGPVISSNMDLMQPSLEDFLNSFDVNAPPLRASISGVEPSPFYDTNDPGVHEKYLPSDSDITKFLMNNEMGYQKVWEPWLTKAAVRCIATDSSKEFLAVGGGYLYDNEIHIYRWNSFTREYDKVWDSGDQIIQGDVLSIAFGDLDHNDFMDIAAGSADGHVYVFEQEHIYDPIASTENQFAHVWTSPNIQQVWGVAIADSDLDGDFDIIAGSWDKKVHFYEYTNHSGYPFSKDHWIEFTEKATIDVGEKVFSVAVGDTNPTPNIQNADLPDVVVGTELGRVYIYENNGTRIYVNGKPFALKQDNSYRYHWDSGNITWKPILRTIVDNLDDDKPDEIAYIAVGQDAVVINYEDLPIAGPTYLTHRLWAPLESWQLGGLEGLGHYLNHYIDFMTWSNNNVSTTDTFDAYVLSDLTQENLTNLHVYWASIAANALVPEPHAYGWEPQWPKNTSMAIHRKLDPWGEDGVYIDMNGDGIVDDNPIGGIYDINHDPAENYTIFKAWDTHASAIVDWGKDQEPMGDGLFAIPEEGLGYDIVLRFHESTLPNLDKMSFELSRGDGEWVVVPDVDISLRLVSAAAGDDDLLMDIDPILSNKHWAYFRYMRINVTDNGMFMIKGGYAPVLYRPMDAATSITIGSLDLDYYKAYTSGESEGKKIVLGTADGKVIMFEYDKSTHSYNLLWNSYTNDSYTQGTNIWDIVEVKSPGKIPTWLYNNSKSNILRDDPDVPYSLDEKIFEYEFNNSILPGSIGQFASVTHVPLFSSFFNAIFELPAFEPFSDIVELKIPDNDMVIGTTNGKLLIMPELTHELSGLGGFDELSKFFFFDTNTNPFYNGKSVSPTFVDFNQDFDKFPEIMLLGWAGNAPGELYDPEFGNKAVAGLDVYTYDPIAGPLGIYTGKFELKDLEITGLLERALEKAQRMPEVAVGDMDGDGDQDIVLTNGRIYYLENINNALFVLNPEYFDDLILKATDRLFYSPELYDFDADGDLDLTVGWDNRKGTIVSTTYYENIGSRWAPQWEENKWLYTNSWGGLRFNNLTKASLAYDRSGKVSHITAYNAFTHELVQLYAEYENHNAFVIGTNPIIARLEINLKSGTDSHGNELANYGYHVFETWSSEAELNHWTLALKTGDMDQDGRKEVIIGDYDNNLYVFEHLTNNTFKRAFRSQDITHSELTATSPYAWDQFDGISGTFYRTIWDHVEEIVVGLDMDNDGFLEMAATAGLSVFVWEQNNNGFVSVDDEYTLIWQADLRQSAWAPLFADLGISSFTAAAYGGDIDYNGYGEFILAAGSFLFVFESNGADSFYENFLVNPFPVRGRYFIPGNPLSSPAVRTLSIESIVVADTDNDTLNEIIIGGVNKTWWGQYNGFVAILENQIGTYAYTWWAPSRTMEDNPVYDIVVDNNDYDHYKEIIVGTFKGVVIYENYALTKVNRDNCYIERSILTSFVNFPYMKLEQMFDIEAKVKLALRNTDMVELQYNYDAVLTKGLWIQVFKAGLNIFWATSTNYGVDWTQRGPISTSAITHTGGPHQTSFYEYHPSIHQTREGRIFLSFTGSLQFVGGPGVFTSTGIWLYELVDNFGVHEWINPLDDVAINGAPLSPHILYNPAVWDYGANVGQGVGISYMNSTNGGIYWQGVFSNPDADPMARIPHIGRDALANNATWEKPGYKALSHDAVRSFNGEVVIAFTGLKFVEGKVDYDIWIAKSNTSTMWDLNGRYNRATSDGIDELHPSITQTVTPDHTLMIIYEADGSHPSGALHVTYSKDEGNTWRDPESVTTIPPFAEYRVFPILGFSLLVLKDYPNIVVKSLISVGPAITPHYEGGFAYSFMAQYAFYALPTLSVKQSVSALTANQGYVASVATSGATQVSAGDISAHSGLVESVGGTLTTGGGDLSYQGELVGSFADLTVSGGGSAISYASTTTYKPIVVYTTPIVTEEEGITGYGGNLLAYSADATGTDDPSSDQNTGSGSSPGMTLSHGFAGREDFHSSEKDRDRGYYNNIFFGMNPSSNFTKFDFKEARAISTGDSDKDYRREIAIASGSRAYLVEVSRTGGNDDEIKQVLDYYQAWQSDPLATETTDIELFDANGNGMDEVIVSCTKGNVYSFEGMVTDPAETDFHFIDWDMMWMSDDYAGYFMESVPKPQNLLVSTDVNRDGFDDVLIGKMDPNVDNKGYEGYPLIQALDGATGNEFWIFNLTSSQYPFTKNSSIINMMGIDLDLDGVDDLVFFAYDYNWNELYLYGLIIGESGATEAWEPAFFDDIIGNEISEYTLADITGDSTLDILVALTNSVHYVDGSDGSGPYYFHTVEDASWTIEHISVGNNTLLLSSRNGTNGHVTYIDFNETVIHEFTLNNTEFGLTAVQMPLTEDDHEDILIVESGVIFAFDGLINISDQLWNKSLDNTIGNYEDAFRYDFNGDSFDDVMFQTMGTNGNYTSTFEEYSDFERIAYKEEGLIYSNLNNSAFEGWTAINYSGSGVVTPHSGDMMVGTIETDNFIEIKSGAYRVSAWFGTDNIYANDFVWTAYDEFGNFITNTTFPSNMLIVFAELADPLGRIHTVKVTGSAGPGFESHWVMDDFSYESFGPTRLIALNGINYDDQLWEYHIWNTYATSFSQGDMDRDGENDDLMFSTVFQGNAYPHTGAITVIDSTYGTPLTYIEARGRRASSLLGNFGEFGELAEMNIYGAVRMLTYVRHEPTFFRNIAVQMDDSISFKTLGAVTRMAVGDFNNDGLEDVVFGDWARYLIAINGQNGEMIWKYRVSKPITKIAVSDFHLQDGYTDIAVTLISGQLVMINGETGRRLWDDYLGPVIVNDMKFVDQNQDGVVEELAISMGFRFTSFFGRFVLYNATMDTSSGHGTIIWEKYNPFRPFTRFEAADFSGDGTLDFAVAIYEHSMWILDGGSGGYLRVFPIAVQDFAVGDFNGNPLPMLAIIIRNGTVVTYESNDWSSGVTQSAKMNLVIPFRLSHLEIGDITGDGLDEIIVRSFGNGTYAINGKLTKVLWYFEDRSIFYLPKYLISDMNNDTIVDVLSLNYDNILALNGENGEVVWVSFVASHLITTMTLGDFNVDGTMDVAVGTADGWVYILTGKSEVLIPQQAEIQEKQDMTLPSVASDSQEAKIPPIVNTGNPIEINILLMSFLILIGLTIPVSSLLRKRRYQ